MNKLFPRQFFFSVTIVLLLQGVSPTLSSTENTETVISYVKHGIYTSQKKQIACNASLAYCTPNYFPNREKTYPIGHAPFTPISIIDLKQAFLL